MISVVLSEAEAEAACSVLSATLDDRCHPIGDTDDR